MLKDAILTSKNNWTEICGLLVDNEYFLELIKVENKRKDPGGFSFYSNEIRLIEKATVKLNHKITGTFHSHPISIAEPGDSDVRSCVDDSLMLIIDVVEKNIQLWHIKDKKKKKVKHEYI